MNKDEFKEKLSDPDMAAVRAAVTAMVKNPKYTISRVTYDQNQVLSNDIKVIIELVIPEDNN